MALASDEEAIPALGNDDERLGGKPICCRCLSMSMLSFSLGAAPAPPPPRTTDFPFACFVCSLVDVELDPEAEEFCSMSIISSSLLVCFILPFFLSGALQVFGEDDEDEAGLRREVDPLGIAGWSSSCM